MRSCDRETPTHHSPGVVLDQIISRKGHKDFEFLLLVRGQ